MVSAAASSSPLIGVTCARAVGGAWSAVSKGHFTNYTYEEYLQGVMAYGGAPLILPLYPDRTKLEAVLARLDGLIFSGGPDVNPRLFGEEPLPGLGTVDDARDRWELTAIKVALRMDLPLLGICRGIQVLNVAMGGSLYQDVSTDPGTEIQHSQTEARDQATHKVTVTSGSRLAKVLGADDVEVNSFHHQVVKTLAPGLKAVAWAPDQLIEGVEADDDSRFVLGVQWHPEHLVGRSEPARRLFAALIDAARA
jgi:putative glutamine amidotransferase